VQTKVYAIISQGHKRWQYKITTSFLKNKTLKICKQNTIDCTSAYGLWSEA